MRARSQILLMTASALCCRVCVAVTPGAHLPGQDEVRRFISGRGVTIGMLGDSLSFPLSGSPGVVGASHVNMGIGFIRRFQFHEGHRALFMPPGTQHLYSGLSGVWFGSSNSTPSIEFSDSIGAKDGSIVPTDPDDMAEIQTGRRVRFLQPSPNVVYGNVGLQNLGGPAGVGMPVTFTSTPAAEALLAAPRLEFRVWVTESPTGPLPSVLGIDVVDQNLTTIVGSRTAALSTEPPGDWRKGVFTLPPYGGAYNPQVTSLRARLRTFAGGVGGGIAGESVLIMGSAFADPDSKGALLVPLCAQGGWTTDHHRTDTPGPGGSGYRPQAAASRLVALGFDDPSNFRVLVVALGQNIGQGEIDLDQGTAPGYKENIAAIVDQWAAAAASRGCAFDQVLLLGTAPWGPHGSELEMFRATTRSDLLYELAVERGWWYAGAPYLVVPWKRDYFYIPGADHHLSLAGSEAIGEALWGAFLDAAGPWPCAGDASGNGAVDFDDIISVLNRWGREPPYAYATGDADGDAMVDFDDIVSVLANWLNDCH